MSREDLSKLLGGYATGNLTPEERHTLLAAALEDQDLFDALAKEQALHDALQDVVTRESLIGALKPRRQPWIWRPATLAAAGGLAALLIAGAFLGLRKENSPLPPVPAALPVQSIDRAARPSQSLTVQPGNAMQVKRLAKARPAAQPEMSAVRGAAAPAASPLGVSASVSPAAPEFVSADSVLGSRDVIMNLQYQLLRSAPDGTYLPADGNALHTGDSVRLEVQAPADGTLMLLDRDSTGQIQQIASQAVVKSQEYLLPSSGALGSAVPGELELTLMFMPAGGAAKAAPAGRVFAHKAPAPRRAHTRKIVLEFH